MKYIIMCGGKYLKYDNEPKHITKVNGEPLVARTIRLLKEAGIKEEDIGISCTEPDWFDSFGVKLYLHANGYKQLPTETVGDWVDAFYPSHEPMCYIFGDVVFSPKAIKTIVDTKVEDIMFFASSPPFSSIYSKPWAEPFAYKVVDTKRFFQCIDKVRQLDREGKFNRQPVSWELWQVIKDTPINKINYRNYVAINDYTCDIDAPADVKKIEPYIINDTDCPIYMIHTCPKREWYVNDYIIPSMLEQGIYRDNIIIYSDTKLQGNLKSSVESFTIASNMNVKGVWHLQDDIIICRDFAERTKQHSKDYTVCGFSSYYDKMKNWEPGDSNGLKMWYSFPCIYIPTKIIKSYIDWFNIWVWRDPQYEKWIKEKKYDDTIFRIYMENYYSKEYVLNLKPNLVDHVDYLLGGSIVNQWRKDKQVRAMWFDDIDLIVELEKKLNEDRSESTEK